jgi:hypothetical protein
MGRVIHYEIPDEIYAALERMAARSGVTTEKQVLDYLARRLEQPDSSRRRAGSGRLDRFIGGIDLGHAIGAGNEAIDRDLAREYNGECEDRDS